MRRILFSVFMICLPVLCHAQRDTVIVCGGDTYVGQFPEGKGVLYSEEDGMIIGTFREGIPNGHCVHYRRSGSIYEGEMTDGHYFGNGRYFSLAGNVIAGDFMDNTATGQDTLYYKDNSVYIGSMVDKKPQGKGMKLWRSVRRPQKASVRKLCIDEPYVFLFCDGYYSSGTFRNGVRTYLAYPNHNSIGTYLIQDGVWIPLYYNALAREANHYYSQEDLQREYEDVIRRKPIIPSPLLSQEQINYLVENCRYAEWSASAAE